MTMGIPVYCPSCGWRLAGQKDFVMHDVKQHNGLERMEQVHSVFCANGQCHCLIEMYREAARSLLGRRPF